MNDGRIIPLAEAFAADTLERIRESVQSGGVFGTPTDTIYGLAGDPCSEEAVGRVYALKGRSHAQALPVLVASVDQLAPLRVTASGEVLARLAAIWPAPLTAVLPLARPIAASGGASTLAVRIPDHPLLRRLLEEVGPLMATSANRSGSAPALSAPEVARIFGSGLDFVLDGGPSGAAVPSTLVDLTKGTPEILRSGAYRWF